MNQDFLSNTELFYSELPVGKDAIIRLVDDEAKHVAKVLTDLTIHARRAKTIDLWIFVGYEIKSLREFRNEVNSSINITKYND